MATFIVKCDDCTIEYKVGSRKKSKDGKFRCKKCKSKLYNQRNKKIIRQHKKTDKAKQTARAWRLKKYYGLSLEDYSRLLKQQHGVCAICRIATEGDSGHPLAVDHDHKTNKVRGLLCDKCNRAIGLLNDDLVFFNNAMTYLNRGQSWHQYFISVASTVSTRSKDPSTQVGAVIVKDKVIISTGFNGFARGENDSKIEFCSRDEKLKHTIHAEDNAIFNAARYGMKTMDTDIYITMHPCHKCTRGIIQAGIKRVFIRNIELPDRWKKDFEISKKMMQNTNISYEMVEID